MRSKYYNYIIGTTIGVLVLIVFANYFYLFSYRAPSNFPNNTIVRISGGKSIVEIASELKKESIIRSPFWFSNYVILLKQEKSVVGGEYYFESPVNVYEVAKRLTRGTYNVEQLKTTIPEGISVFEIAAIIKKIYPDFNDESFITLAKPKEGYLFPDTYQFGANPKPEKVIQMMSAVFERKLRLSDINESINDSGKSIEDVIKMASLVEGEARQTRTRRIVAGILWERLRQGIPLQVDATFKYINGKTTATLTSSDLKIDSPYNTYVYKGLPPTPISNPGLDSILAAVTPIPTKYLYFLTDKDGNMHYTETFEEHVRNKRRYLDN